MNFLFGDVKEQVRFAVIKKKVSNTLYSLTDQRGRKFNAEGDGSYRVGQSVSVKSGVIIGKAKVPKVIKHFNV